MAEGQRFFHHLPHYAQEEASNTFRRMTRAAAAAAEDPHMYKQLPYTSFDVAAFNRAAARHYHCQPQQLPPAVVPVAGFSTCYVDPGKHLNQHQYLMQDPYFHEYSPSKSDAARKRSPSSSDETDPESPPDKKMKMLSDAAEPEPASEDDLSSFALPATEDVTFAGFMELLSSDHVVNPVAVPDNPISHTDDNGSIATPPGSPLMSPTTPHTPATPATPTTPPHSSGGAGQEKRRTRKRQLQTPHGGEASPESVTIAIPSAKRINKKNASFMRDGSIVFLRLTNFIVHKQRRWEWSPHLNVVVGPNGSGKTALQNAVMVVLGAKAAETARYKVLSGFIKYHCNSAEVEIALTNYHGTLSKSRYGEEVRVKVTIGKTSTTRKVYCVDTEQWHVVKRADWDMNFLRPLQIHLNNPAQFFTQEAATVFRKTENSRAEKLYKQFKDATLITPYEEFLSCSENNMADCLTILKEKESGELESCARKAKEFQILYEKVLEIERYKVVCQKLLHEYVWSLVIQDEREEANLYSQINEIDMEIEKYNQVQCTAKQKLERITTEHDSEKRNVSNLEAELRALGSKQEDSRNSLRELNKEVKAIEGKIRLVREHIANLKDQDEELDKKLKDSMEVSETNRLRSMAEAQSMISTLQTSIEGGERANATLKEDRAELVRQRSICKNLEEERKKAFTDCNDMLKERERDLKTMQKKESTKYDKFGAQMKNLVNKIDRGKWAAKPLGPIAVFLTIKAEYKKFAPMIEDYLGTFLHSFVITQSSDMKVLRSHICSSYGNPDRSKIIPGVIDLRIKERHGEYWKDGKAQVKGAPTLLDALDIAHPRILDALIEKQHPEKVVLFETNDEACEVMKRTQKVPHTCGITMQNQKILAYPNYSSRWFGPSNQGPRMSTKYLQTTQVDNVSEVKAEIDRIRQDAAALKLQWQQAQTTTRDLDHLIFLKDNEIKFKNSEIFSWRSHLRTHQEALNHLSAIDPQSQNEVILDQKEEISQEVNAREIELQALTEQREILGGQVDQRSSEYNCFTREIKRLENRIKSCKDEAGIFTKEVQRIQKEIDTSQAKIRQLKEQRSILNTKRQEVTRNKNKKIKSAKKDGERLETPRPAAEILMEYEGKVEFYKKNLDLLKQKPIIRKSQLKWETNEKNMRRDIDYVKSFINKTLRPLLQFQQQKLIAKRDEYLQCFDTYFKAFISRRGYGGETVVDTEKERLLYYTTVDDGGAQRAATCFKKKPDGTRIVKWRQLKDYILKLSGGESSFSNMSYICALHQIMSAPFSMMDEFDVFMDSANRSEAFQIFLDQAKSLLDVQFFVCVPDEINLSEGPYMTLTRLHKMD